MIWDDKSEPITNITEDADAVMSVLEKHGCRAKSYLREDARLHAVSDPVPISHLPVFQKFSESGRRSDK